MSVENIVSFKYCTQCKWLLRTAWMSQELLNTFETDISEVRLLPSTGGTFTVTVNGEEIWDRAKDGGFPDIKILKQKVRDRIAPEKDLGHTDRKKESSAT